jgi:hypothetical protein
MKYLLFLFSLITTLTLVAQSPKFDWVTHEGNGSEDFGWKIRKSTNGDMYVAIGFKGSTSVGGTVYTQVGTSNYDFLICKYNSSGSLQWAKQLYGSFNFYFPELETDGAGNLYISNGFSGTLVFNSTSYTTSSSGTLAGNFLAKIDNSGNILWAKIVAKTWGSAGGSMKMAVKTNGDVFLVGYMSDSISVNNITYKTAGITNGGIGMFYLSYLSNGTYDWHTLGEGTYINFKEIRFDNSGGSVYGIGSFSNSHTFVNNSSATITSTPGDQDVFLVQIQATAFAYASWAKSFGSTGNDQGEKLVIDANNNIYVLANISGDCNIDGINLIATSPKTILAKFNSAGNASFVNAFASSQSFQAFTCTDLNTDILGNIYASGSLGNDVQIMSDTLHVNGSSDALIVKLNSSNGNAIWSKQFGGSAMDDIRSATCLGDNEIYCTGKFASSVSFGSFQNTSFGSVDPYIAKLSGCDFPSVNITYNGSTTLCNGENLTLGVNSIQGASMQWLKNNVALPNETGISIVASSSGIYSLDISLGGVCRDTFGSIDIAVNSINANIQSAQSSICPDGALQLYTNIPFSSYAWSTGVNTPTINIGQKGDYFVTVTDGVGCKDTATITIGEYPLPPVPSILEGANCQLASSIIQNGYGYKWRLNGSVVGSNSAYLDAGQHGSGFYTLEITNTNGCKAGTITPLSITCTVGIDEMPYSSVKVFPNPSNGLFLITDLPRDQVGMLRILNLTGQSVFERVLTPEFSTEVDIRNVQCGIYLLEMSIAEMKFYKRLVIE